MDISRTRRPPSNWNRVRPDSLKIFDDHDMLSMLPNETRARNQVGKDDDVPS